MRALEVIVRSTGLVTLAVMMLLSLSCGAEPPSPSTVKVEQTVVPTATPEPVADEPLLHPERAVATAPEEYRVRVETSEGVVVIRVVRAWAPHGADRFYNLVKLGYYDDTRFFRVIDGFMAQVGFHGDPEVTAAWRGAAIPDDPPQRPNSRGTVTFAKTNAPDSRTTQFFVNTADNAYLAQYGAFAPFGEVEQGMEVVDALYAGYGEGAPQGPGPNQATIAQRGNTYLDEYFPLLDRIVTARVVAE